MFSLLVVMALAGDAKPVFDPVGTWEGALNLEVMKLRLVFRIEKGTDGKLTGLMDSVDQGAKDVELKTPTIEDGQLKLELKEQPAEFLGKPSDDGQTITGKWKQGGQELDLVLKRVAKPTELKRPQNPTKPYPYHEEEVTVENTAAKDVILAGTLTIPEGDGPFPAVVLITGSGPQDRDESIMGHKPFLVLADHLTRKGVAVLRWDDRGVGKSKGSQKGATSADFAGDAYACVKVLQSRKEIDNKRIGLAGHSEGGLIAPIVAAEHPDEIGFIILLAGTGLPGDQVLKDQSAALIKAMKTDEKKAAMMARLQACYMKAACDSADAKKIAESVRAFRDSLKPEERGLLDAEDKDGEEQVFKQLTSPWMQFFLRHDPRPTLKKVRCPVLAINGELDLQVTPKDNLPAIMAALNAGGNKNATVVELPGLNHLFQKAKTGLPTEYGEIEETIAPEALDLITTWIQSQKS
jgi:pimeloyl-ACP methyl ester carboxylesterase